jgi:hypothetical protein
MVPLPYTGLKFQCYREIGKTVIQHTCDSLHFNFKITLQPEIGSLASEWKGQEASLVIQCQCANCPPLQTSVQRVINHTRQT